jgi:hypothetical protein
VIRLDFDISTMNTGTDRPVITCAYLGTIQMGETLFDGQARRLSYILPAEACPGSEGEERDLVAVVECEG